MFSKKQIKWIHVCYYAPIGGHVSELLCSYNDDGSKDYETIPVTTSNYNFDEKRIIQHLENIDKENNKGVEHGAN